MMVAAYFCGTNKNIDFLFGHIISIQYTLVAQLTRFMDIVGTANKNDLSLIVRKMGYI
jgi:hypothetical protein